MSAGRFGAACGRVAPDGGRAVSPGRSAPARGRARTEAAP